MLIRPNCCEECRGSVPHRRGQDPLSSHLRTLGLIEWSLGSFITAAGDRGGGRTDSPWRWQSRPSDTKDDFSPHRACRDQPWLESNWPWNECLPPPPPSLVQRRLAALWLLQPDRCGQRQQAAIQGPFLLWTQLVFDISTVEGDRHAFFSWIEIRKIVHPKATCLKV